MHKRERPAHRASLVIATLLSPITNTKGQLARLPMLQGMDKTEPVGFHSTSDIFNSADSDFVACLVPCYSGFVWGTGRWGPNGRKTKFACVVMCKGKPEGANKRSGFYFRVQKMVK